MFSLETSGDLSLGKNCVLNGSEYFSWTGEVGRCLRYYEQLGILLAQALSLLIQLCLEEIWKHLHLENNVPHSPSRLSGMINNPGSPSCRPLFVTASYYT